MNRLAARPTARPTASDNPIVTVLLIAVLHASTAWRSCSRIGRPADQWHPCCPFNSPAARRIKVHHSARHLEEGQEVCTTVVERFHETNRCTVGITGKGHITRTVGTEDR